MRALSAGGLKSAQEETAMELNLYNLKQVSEDFIILTDGVTDVRITFADTPPGMDFINPTKEEHAAFFKHIQCQVGLEAPVLPSTESRTISIFLDHQVVDYGLLRSSPFLFPVAKVEVFTSSTRLDEVTMATAIEMFPMRGRSPQVG